MKLTLFFISISFPMLSFCAAGKDIERFEKLVIEAKKISTELSKKSSTELSKKSSRKFWHYFNKKKKQAKRNELKRNELNKTHEKIIDLWNNESHANLGGENYTSILTRHDYISTIKKLDYQTTFPKLSSWQTPVI